MPRMAKSQEEKFLDNFRTNIDKYLAMYYTGRRQEAVKKMGFSVPTFCHRYKDPGSFTLQEIMDMAKFNNISISTLLGIGKEE